MSPLESVAETVNCISCPAVIALLPMALNTGAALVVTEIVMDSVAVSEPSDTLKVTLEYVPVVAGVQENVLVDGVNVAPDGRLEAE